MRTKDEILEEAHRFQLKRSDRDTIISLHERLMIEVLIDIRDALVTDVKDALNALIEIRKTH